MPVMYFDGTDHMGYANVAQRLSEHLGLPSIGVPGWLRWWDVSRQMVMVPSCPSIAVQPRKAISRIQRKQELRTTAMFCIRVAG
jgi:hypothetical protein